MEMIDYLSIRKALAEFPSDHDAAGSQRPTVEEIFTPEQHANALDPNTPVVVGARGTGKSFWTGVLVDDETRNVAALAYPHLRLDRLIVKPGYTGFDTDGAVMAKTINARVPEGKEVEYANAFWSAVIMRAAHSALNPDEDPTSIREVMNVYGDPEDFSSEIKRIDKKLAAADKVLLVTFDALDTISRDWKRSGKLIDALLEVIWSLRARQCIRAKLFIRPEQLADDSLRFVELPKLRSGRIELTWTQTELYGLLFWRLHGALNIRGGQGFEILSTKVGAPVEMLEKGVRYWPLIVNSSVQKDAMTLLAGPYMGRNAKRGGTYDWPYNHLADAAGNVTPRSFIQLFVGAAQYKEQLDDHAISARGIQDGLRQASKVRVEELVVEYQWIKRALLPLAGLIVPCQAEVIWQRWNESKTVNTIMKVANDPEGGFMPPFPSNAQGDHNQLLADAMERIGVFSYRSDGRIDMPDLFLVAARMLKRGGISNRRTIEK
ncbi:MAG: hypothetical protein JWM30_3687 [Burkholderia sp.]|nr:hypothetical protein [Burkholderia sp.]